MRQRVIVQANAQYFENTAHLLFPLTHGAQYDTLRAMIRLTANSNQATLMPIRLVIPRTEKVPRDNEEPMQIMSRTC